MLFPVFSSARSKARQTSCLNNLHQLGLVFAQYSADYDDYATPPYNLGGVAPIKYYWFGSQDESNNKTPNWRDSPLFTYSRSWQLSMCPESPEPKNILNIQGEYARLSWGVGINQKILTPNLLLKLSVFTDPTNTIWIADSGWYANGEVRRSWYIYWPSQTSYLANSGGGIRPHTNGFANGLWMDYHVKAFRPTVVDPNSDPGKAGLGQLINPKYPMSDNTTYPVGNSQKYYKDWYFEPVKPDQ